MKILVGAGGNAIDFISHMKRPCCIQLIDDYAIGEVLGYPIVGTVSEFLDKKDSFMQTEIYNCVGSSGNNETRNEVYWKLYKAGIRPKNVLMSSFISKNVVFGDNILANAGSQIHHDCIIDSNTVISPGVIVCGDVHIYKNAFIGANATIIQNVYIGENSIIGAGSVVTKSVPPNEVWAGNPARFIKGRSAFNG